YECPRGSPLYFRAQSILRALAGRREDRQGRPRGLHAQAVDDPERHGETSHPLATSGGTRGLADKAPLTNKTVAPLRSRFRAQLRRSVTPPAHGFEVSLASHRHGYVSHYVENYR